MAFRALLSDRFSTGSPYRLVKNSHHHLFLKFDSPQRTSAFSIEIEAVVRRVARKVSIGAQASYPGGNSFGFRPIS